MSDLSETSAQLNTSRMLDDVSRGTKRIHPPRMPIPLSAREAFVATSTTEEEGSPAPAASARVADASSGSSGAGSTVPPPINYEDTVKNIVDACKQLDGRMYLYISQTDRRTVMESMYGPNSFRALLNEIPLATFVVPVVLAAVVGWIASRALTPKPPSPYGMFEGSDKPTRPPVATATSPGESAAQRAIRRMVKYS